MNGLIKIKEKEKKRKFWEYFNNNILENIWLAGVIIIFITGFISDIYESMNHNLSILLIVWFIIKWIFIGFIWPILCILAIIGIFTHNFQDYHTYLFFIGILFIIVIGIIITYISAKKNSI